MDDAPNGHPDEGTIHAWLDGAFDDPTASRIADHVSTCDACAERVAEARGLIAGASRVVSALDDVPSGVTPVWGSAPAAATVGAAAGTRGAGSAWRLLRVTPTRAAIAATLLVALGVALTHDRTAIESGLQRSTTMTPAAPASAPFGVPARDPLLDSAVARNLAIAQPPRAVQAAPGLNVAVPKDVTPPPATIDESAPVRVASGRAAVQARADSAAFSADRARVGAAGADSRAIVAQRTIAAAKVADSIASPPIGTMAASAPVAGNVRAQVASVPECYRIESASGTAASWGDDPLPLVVALDATGRGARVLSPAGVESKSRAVWTKAGDDSLVFQLRRTGYEGTLALGAPGDARAGVMRSMPDPRTLAEAAAAAGAEAPAARRRARAAPAPAPITAAPATPVVAKRIGCPGSE